VHVRTWQAAYRGMVPDAYLAGLSVDQREATWGGAITSGTPRLLVAKEEGDVVGWIAFGPCRDDGASAHAGEIWALYVAPEFWASGAGRMLWLAARERMIEEGYHSVSLWVIAGNARAIRFYLAAGFAAEPSSRKAFTLGGETLREVRYRLALGG
jgi:ribosomal protein S18 acetylase RimI-like enzyme